MRTPDKEANATGQKLTIAGHTVYAVYIDAGMGYRNDRTSGIATGDQPEEAPSSETANFAARERTSIADPPETDPRVERSAMDAADCK